MMSEQEITGRLEKLGYKNAEIRTALRDVAQIIVVKTVRAYLDLLPPESRDAIKGMSEAELQSYLNEHRAELPPMPQEAFEKIHDGTWENYFQSVA